MIRPHTSFLTDSPPEQVIIHEADTINADATIALYDKIQQRYYDQDRIYVIRDNARYYRKAQLQA